MPLPFIPDTAALPQLLRLKLSPLAEAITGQPLVDPAIVLTALDPTQLQLVSAHGRFVFDRQRGQVQRDGIDIAAFEAVQSVDIGSFPGGRGAPSWSVSLYMGFFRRVTLGRTYDDGEASVVAARLARLLDRKVVSLALRG